MAYSVYLKKGEEREILRGRSWVYANEAARIEGKDKNGSLATVYSYDGKFVGKGYINHLSRILVRIFIRDEKETDDKEFFVDRLKKADAMRSDLALGEAYRLCYGEADGLPSLIVDRYGDVLSVQFLSLGFDKRKTLITEALAEAFSPDGIYERSDAAVRLKEGLEPAVGVLYGEVPEKVIVEENGVKLYVDVRNGQKTGYFLDQKDNRYAVRRYCRGKTVLDCFSNTGGFSMNAATVAKEVTSVDISERAVGELKANAALNGFTNVTAVCADVFEELRKYRKEGRRFDVVILDPPAFCKSAAEVKDAYRGYKDINVLGMKLVLDGGYLVTSSCSHYMTMPLFEKMLAEAASESGRAVRILEVKVQAPDHPVSLTDGETGYLKFYVLDVNAR